MKKHIPVAEPTQVGAADSTNSFLELIRGTLRREAEKMLVEEVTALCGRSHYPQVEVLYRRAGSEAGVCYAAGRREPLQRPRVRRRGANGQEQEHVLASYQMMNDPTNNAAAVVTADAGRDEHPQPSVGQ